MKKIFTGSVVRQNRDALNFIDSNIIQEQVSKVPNKAESVRYFNYPFQAVEEALVNAVYHRSYERENPVEIQIHPDRIEILSFPGPMPPVDKEMLKKERIIAREYRNRKLGGFLKELKLTEGRGTGIPEIRRRLEENGSPQPVFETDNERMYFLSIIKIHPLFDHTRTSGAKDRDEDGAKDNILNINSLTDVDSYLRLFDDQRWAKDKGNITSKIDKVIIKTLAYCIEPKTRDNIFKQLELFNNTKNYNRHVKPLIELGWLELTQPDKPTSKNQKYKTSEVAKRLVEPANTRNKRIPVASANIASVGYDADKKMLEIEFHDGRIYQYIDVPEAVYQELISSPSIGSYFFHNIRNNFSHPKT